MRALESIKQIFTDNGATYKSDLQMSSEASTKILFVNGGMRSPTNEVGSESKSTVLFNCCVEGIR
jgi:hypothetical protein